MVIKWSQCKILVWFSSFRESVCYPFCKIVEIIFLISNHAHSCDVFCLCCVRSIIWEIFVSCETRCNTLVRLYISILLIILTNMFIVTFIHILLKSKSLGFSVRANLLFFTTCCFIKLLYSSWRCNLSILVLFFRTWYIKMPWLFW
jgi:hypothetical protein